VATYADEGLGPATCATAPKPAKLNSAKVVIVYFIPTASKIFTTKWP